MGLQTRTTAFSCDGNKEDYDENLLMSRPLPWVVRVYFKSEKSMKGTLCSGLLYDILKQRTNIRPKLNRHRRYGHLICLKSIRIFSSFIKCISKTFTKLEPTSLSSIISSFYSRVSAVIMCFNN